jgi:AraC-like DNA-binding protein
MGAIAKIKATPVIATRHKTELETSPSECVYASYVLSGELHIRQGRHDFTAGRGDLVVYDSRYPVVMTEKSAGQFENLSFRIDRDQLRSVENSDDALSCALISAEKMIAPLAGCLGYFSENFLALPAFEAASLFEVFGALLPVATLALAREHDTSAHSDVAQRALMRELLEYIDANLDAPELSPRSAAAELGISLRYVHKLFAEKGMTFCGHVTSQRLDHVRRDLSLPAFRHEPIYALAARRGFADASAFNRIFKERFGLTPGQARALTP